eukprot:1861334-Pyramimonas_sp.AAC.1
MYFARPPPSRSQACQGARHGEKGARPLESRGQQVRAPRESSPQAKKSTGQDYIFRNIHENAPCSKAFNDPSRRQQ